MDPIEIKNSQYHSEEKKVSLLPSLWPSFAFYMGFLKVVYLASRTAKAGKYSTEVWRDDSTRVLRLLEGVGIRFYCEGFDNLSQVGPCVIVGNHMSMMETVVLPAIVLPRKKVTFVVKDSLLTYPVFKHVMRACNPVAVTRTNPRQDLKTVMSEGLDRLNQGTSIIVFPQTTRAADFVPENFGSIGVKLAKKAGVPVIPMALKTDAWKNGTWSKDLGNIDPAVPARIAFGKPIEIGGKGAEEHQQVISFITDKLEGWKK